MGKGDRSRRSRRRPQVTAQVRKSEDAGSRISPDETDDMGTPGAGELYPTNAVALLLFLAVNVLGYAFSNVVVNPGNQSHLTVVKALIGSAVGIPISVSIGTLTAVATAALRLTRSADARRMVQLVAQRAGVGAIYGTLLGVSAVAWELTKVRGKPHPLGWDVLGVIGDTATWGTLVGLAGSIVAAQIYLFKIMSGPKNKFLRALMVGTHLLWP
ncbi:hypothetical protein GCM10010486_81900 [Nonomuraea roseoviolacea subsp. carminata]